MLDKSVESKSVCYKRSKSHYVPYLWWYGVEMNENNDISCDIDIDQ